MIQRKIPPLIPIIIVTLFVLIAFDHAIAADADLATDAEAIIQKAKSQQDGGDLDVALDSYTSARAMLTKAIANDDPAKRVKAKALYDSIAFLIMDAERLSLRNKAAFRARVQKCLDSAKSHRASQELSAALDDYGRAKSVIDHPDLALKSDAKKEVSAIKIEIDKEIADVTEQEAKAERERQAALALERNRPVPVNAPPQYTAPANDEPKKSAETPLLVWLIGGVIGLTILIGICAVVASTQCPNCKAYFAKQVLNSSGLDNRTVYRTVTKTDVHRDSKGNQIGTTQREETVPEHQQYVRSECFCAKCQHSWIQEGWR